MPNNPDGMTSLPFKEWRQLLDVNLILCYTVNSHNHLCTYTKFIIAQGLLKRK